MWTISLWPTLFACKQKCSLIPQEHDIVCRFRNITFTRCTAHTLDLLLEDICKLPWAKDMRSEAMSIVSFLTRHHMSQALFRKQSEQHSKGLQLKKPGVLPIKH